MRELKREVVFTVRGDKESGKKDELLPAEYTEEELRVMVQLREQAEQAEPGSAVRRTAMNSLMVIHELKALCGAELADVEPHKWVSEPVPERVEQKPEDPRPKRGRTRRA